MEKALQFQNRHWTKGKYENYLYRENLTLTLKKFDLKEVLILTGIRRSGKSTMFRLIINHLIDTGVNPGTILTVNFDDPFFVEICEDSRLIEKIIEISDKLTGQKTEYLFFDEIHQVKNWEKYVKSAYDSERFKKICLTGSNSALLEGEYVTRLSGRYIVQQVFPYSFSERLNHNNINNLLSLNYRKSEVLSLVDDMMEFGGYPEVSALNDNDMRREIILSYYETIILKDCVAKGAVREIKKFRQLVHYMVSNMTSLYSYNSLSRKLDASDMSIKEFVQLLENSFFISELKLFSYSVATQTRNRKKIYCVDNAFPANVSFRFSSNKGILFENLVFTEFSKLGAEIFYFNDTYECDFIVKLNNDFEAVQVSIDLEDENVLERELRGLKKAMSALEIQKGTIITYNTEKELENIRAVPFWKYFFRQ